MADPLGVALWEPEIPDNAGAVARLCAATGSSLHLIGRLGFSLRHPRAQRAGMDYWQAVEVHRHLALADFFAAATSRRVWLLSTHGVRSLYEARFAPGDLMLFGPESRGLPAELLRERADSVLRIPMRPEARSLNLATSVAAALYEGVRQLGGIG